MNKKTSTFSRRFFCFVIWITFLFYGCSGGNAENANKNNEPTMPETKSATVDQQQIQDISDNPAFFTAVEIEPQIPEAKEMLQLLVPVFDEQLKQVKLIEEHGEYTDGQYPDVKYTLTFVSRKLFDMKDCDDLHALFLQNGFNPSPRLGKKPSHGGTFAAMSFFKTVKSPKTHSISLRMNLLDVKIIVYVYKPNSPLDRM